MHGQIAIAELKPALTAQTLERLHERPSLIAPSPASDRIGQSGQGVNHRIQVGRDAEAKMLEVIASVDDEGQLFGR
jgi:hypothetical protein